jgi:hypothetical protein
MKKLGRFLVLEGTISIGLAYLMYYVAVLTSSMEILYEPFEWIGMGLRCLSLSSSIGNMLALFLYGMLSLSPLLYLLLKRKRTGLEKIDLLLPVISLFCFYMLYHFVNPGLMLKWAPQQINADPSFLGIVKIAFVIIFYSLCLANFMLRMLGTLTSIEDGDHQQSLSKKLQLILEILSVLYTFLIGYFSTFELFAALEKYSAKTGNDPLFSSILPTQGSSSLDQFIVILNYLLQCLPVIFAIYILAAGVQLIKEMTAHHMETEEYQAAAKLSKAGKNAVYVTIFSNLTLNVIQFFLSNQLRDTDFNLNITLSPLIIAFGAMILAVYFKETKELHEDNEMII